MDKGELILKYHFEEILLILFISNTDLSNYEREELTLFAECIENRTDVLFKKEYLLRLNKYFPDISSPTINYFEKLHIELTSIYESQWSQKMWNKNGEWDKIKNLSEKILKSLNIKYQEPTYFRDNNLEVNW
jgi:hypothetical protein